MFLSSGEYVNIAGAVLGGLGLGDDLRALYLGDSSPPAWIRLWSPDITHVRHRTGFGTRMVGSLIDESQSGDYTAVSSLVNRIQRKEEVQLPHPRVAPIIYARRPSRYVHPVSCVPNLHPQTDRTPRSNMSPPEPHLAQPT